MDGSLLPWAQSAITRLPSPFMDLLVQMEEHKGWELVLPLQHPWGIKLQFKEFLASRLWELKICYSEQGGRGKAVRKQLRSQHHCSGCSNKQSPDTQILHLHQICVSLSIKVTRSLQMLAERFVLSLVTPYQTQLHHHSLPFLPLSCTSLSANSAPAAQSCFCNTHMAQALQQDLGRLWYGGGCRESLAAITITGSFHHDWHSSALAAIPQEPSSLASATSPTDGSAPQVTVCITCLPPDPLPDPELLVRVLVMVQWRSWVGSYIHAPAGSMKIHQPGSITAMCTPLPVLTTMRFPDKPAFKFKVLLGLFSFLKPSAVLAQVMGAPEDTQLRTWAHAWSAGS